MPQSPDSLPADQTETEGDVHDDRPPILGSWKRIYALVLTSQALLILLFYWFTVSYR